MKRERAIPFTSIGHSDSKYERSDEANDGKHVRRQGRRAVNLDQNRDNRAGPIAAKLAKSAAQIVAKRGRSAGLNAAMFARNAVLSAGTLVLSAAARNVAGASGTGASVAPILPTSALPRSGTAEIAASVAPNLVNATAPTPMAIAIVHIVTGVVMAGALNAAPTEERIGKFAGTPIVMAGEMVAAPNATVIAVRIAG